MQLNAQQTIYAAWVDGEITATEAVRGLCMDLGEVDSELEPMQQEHERLRSYIGEVLEKVEGQKMTIAGFGTVSMQGGSLNEGYDKKAINALIYDLIDEGNEAMATRLRACATKSWRKVSLRIEREKK